MQRKTLLINIPPLGKAGVGICSTASWSREPETELSSDNCLSQLQKSNGGEKPACEQDISRTPRGNFLKCGTNVHLDSRMK